ncbi:MAG: EAL domain-containing protein [Sulfuricurvum sp.]|jgi:diguanylate cyclase (GGDEF)-like protein/PAS domain S-box-containing protein|uniref:putative bifunctional diguanylate cyclase/phosphodiesterase n=1 Tax=Sulfuricurvum sp. TaxID=2025608 RepID=UPI0025F0927E|nr:EAL domain-containing protein [Sulfuricurvum sp.]MCK9372723.1 EAL domain-containing protein [Sulfuricurvum sp.]
MMRLQRSFVLPLLSLSAPLCASDVSPCCSVDYTYLTLSLLILILLIIAGILRTYALRTRLTQLKNELHNRDDQAKLTEILFENNSDPIIISDIDTNEHVVRVNSAFEKLTGYSSDEIQGKKLNILYSGHHDKAYYEGMKNAINLHGSWEGEIVDRHKSGYLFSKWLTIRTLFHEDGHPYRRIAIFSDLNDDQESRQKIWYQANFDLLTALPNRNLFMYRLEKELHEIERTRLPLALMFLDLDNFKEVNDSFGHDEGDVLLREAARRITQCVRKNDIVSRLGGDEFTIILPGVNDELVIDKIAVSLLSELARSFDLHGEKAFISASVGIAVAPTDGLSAEVLLKHADQAMYSAKKEGRNRYHYFTPMMQDALHKRHQLADEMREAIKNGEFVLYYQPILHVESKTIHKAEALIRWMRHDGTLVSPADFIPLSEDTGMIVELGKWIFDEVSTQLKVWREHYDPTFQISINISPVEFRSDSSQCLKLSELIDNQSLPADAIVVEITEMVLMEQSDATIKTLQKFDHRGITLSIDDFGLGHSSLAHLKKFDVTFLKIDKTFVRDLETDNDNRILCEAIAIMAHRLGIKVIAEGVETAAQRNYLESIQCDYIQGYYIARPMPSDEFAKRFFHPIVKT